MNVRGTGHLTHIVGGREESARLLDGLLDGQTRRGLPQHEAFGRHVGGGEIGDDPVDAAAAGGRVESCTIFGDPSRATCSIVMITRRAALDEVQRPAHPVDHRAGDEPVGHGPLTCVDQVRVLLALGGLLQQSVDQRDRGPAETEPADGEHRAGRDVDDGLSRAG